MGGKAAPTHQTVEQTNLPAYAEPYVLRMLSRAESESQRPYSAYGGQRLADLNAATLQGYDSVMGMAPGLPGLGQAYDVLGNATDTANDVANMGPSSFNAFQFSGPGTYLGDSVDQYMSPYMQNVVDVQKDRAQLDFDRAQAGRDARAVQQGAYGGSRSAVADALAQEELSRQMAEIQAQGQQTAFEQGARMFEMDRQARFAHEGMQSDELARVEAMLDASRLGFGELNAQGAQMQSQLAALYGDFANMDRQAEIERIGLLNDFGNQFQDHEQRFLDMSYQDFLRQQNYPREQLQFFSDILRGNVRGQDTTTTLMEQTNPFRDAFGAGLAGLAMSQSGIF